MFRLCTVGVKFISENVCKLCINSPIIFVISNVSDGGRTILQEKYRKICQLVRCQIKWQERQLIHDNVQESLYDMSSDSV